GHRQAKRRVRQHPDRAHVARHGPHLRGGRGGDRAPSRLRARRGDRDRRGDSRRRRDGARDGRGKAPL
ncbi:MAG: FIG00988253: hypothetical protein, partial [uncultured Rubellimicrobium sp.]